MGSSFQREFRIGFRRKIGDLTNGDLAAPIVAFCVNSERLTGYNLALRLVAVGCTSVYWYRGGFEAWTENNLPTADLVLHEW